MSKMQPVLPPASLPDMALDALGRMMPMFLWLDRRGRIQAVGPTLAKILGPEPVLGTLFARHFNLRRARELHRGMASLTGGRRLNLTLAAYPDFNLRGTAEELGLGEAGGVLVNLSFGIALSDAVRFFGLTEADFAPSDLAMELLYLAEAKAAVLGELRALTGRLEEARRSALSQALSDPLTGLSNRRAFDASLERMLHVLARGGRPFALMHIDLDFFKEVNDTLGHAAGDMVLLRTAEVLQSEIRRGDMAARVGGDEFMLLLRGMADSRQLEGLAARIIRRLEEPILYDGHGCHVSASIGIALSGDYENPSADALLAAADSALYHSKRNGRGCWTMHAG